MNPDDRRYADLVAAYADDAFIVTDAAGRARWANPAFTAMTGYTLDELVGHKPGDLLQGPQTARRTRRVMGRAIAERMPCTVEVVNYRKTGEAYTVSLSIIPIIGAEGVVDAFVSVQRDITETRRLTETCLDFDAFQRALNQHAIVSITDRRGRILHVNGPFCEISGYTSDELVGRDHSVINSGTHPEGFFAAMWRQIADGRVWHGEICNRRKDGSLYWVDTTVVPVVDADGRVVRYVSTRFDITARKAAQEAAERLAYLDPLTGLANRRRFAAHLGDLLEAARHDGLEASLLCCMLDVDDLRAINERHGITVGDAVLAEIAGRLAGELRPVCLAARFGADDFAFTFAANSLHADQPYTLETLHGVLSAPVTVGDIVVRPSLSIGACRLSDALASGEDALINADAALMTAKKGGSGEVRLFSREMRSRRARRAHLKELMREALDADAFAIALQPVIEIDTFRVSSFEVLARLRDGDGFVSPAEFIPLAEETGLIGAIGRSVLRKALDALVRLRAEANFTGRMAVNVAPAQLRSETLVAEVREALAAHGLDGSCLVVEITETAFLEGQLPAVQASLAALRAMGASIALDDFGTGYSSLSHLRMFSVDKVKIDRSFVDQLDKRESDRKLVAGLMDLCHSLGIAVVAEGVETAGQFSLLRSLRCDYSQGYLHARPLDPDEAITFARSGWRGLALRVA